MSYIQLCILGVYTCLRIGRWEIPTGVQGIGYGRRSGYT